MLMFLVPSLGFLVVIWVMCPETSKRTVFEVGISIDSVDGRRLPLLHLT